MEKVKDILETTLFFKKYLNAKVLANDTAKKLNKVYKYILATIVLLPYFLIFR